MSHTWLVNDKNVRAEDYAYGLLDAIALKKGTLKHGVKDICKDEPDQICPPEKSLENPDSLAFVAAGKLFLFLMLHSVLPCIPDFYTLIPGQH